MSKRYNFTIEQGATFTRTFVFKNATTGLPIDITGATVRMMARINKDDADPPVFSLSTTTGEFTIPVGTDGKFYLLIPATTTDDYVAGDRYYDLELVIGTVVRRLLYGTVRISREITRG